MAEPTQPAMAFAIGADKATRIARLFHLLWQGECIARDAAGAQARICCDPKVRRFFALQTGQEALHATRISRCGDAAR